MPSNDFMPIRRRRSRSSGRVGSASTSELTIGSWLMMRSAHHPKDSRPTREGARLALGPCQATGSNARPWRVSSQSPHASSSKNLASRSSEAWNSKCILWLGRWTNAPESWESSSSKRSRCRSVSAISARSFMSALTNSSGTPTTIRNTCSAITRCSAGRSVSGERPDSAVPIASSAVTSSERLAPNGPKRTAETMMRGIRNGSAV